MATEKNNLVDLIQARFGQELAIQSRGGNDTACDVSPDEANFPIAAQILLSSWRSSMAKIGTTSGYGQSISNATATDFLAHKSVNRKYVITCLINSILIFIALTSIQFSSYGSIGTKLIASCVVVLLFVVVAWVVYESNKTALVFKQTDKLRNIIFEIVDNSVDLQKIFTNTPRPWREFFMGSPPLDLTGMARLVAWNLDWYIQRPNIHFRTSWGVITAIVVVMFGLAIGMEPNYNFVMSLLLGVFACLFVHAYESWRKLTGLALLIEETKRIFSEAEIESG